METLKIQIPDMQSAHCQMRVRSAIQKIEGAEIAKLEPGSAEVSLRDTALKSEVISAVEKAGYTVRENQLV